MLVGPGPGPQGPHLEGQGWILGCSDFRSLRTLRLLLLVSQAQFQGLFFPFPPWNLYLIREMVP